LNADRAPQLKAGVGALRVFLYKMVITKKALVLGALVAIVLSVVAFIAYFELGHRYHFGHLVPYGLHVDVLSEEVSIGIPGQKKMYKAELSNFSFFPARLSD